MTELFAVLVPSTTDPTELLNELLSSAGRINLFWDLDSSVRRLLSLLPDSEHISDTLSHHKRTTWGVYRLYYIPGKMFSVSRGLTEATFYDLNQYFPLDSEPVDDDLQSYADRLSVVLSDLGIDKVTTLSSPVACVEASGILDEALKSVPTVFDALEMHLGAYEYAYYASGREWVSNYQIGYWEKGMHSYDLASAYPSIASTLLDLSDCSFTKSEDIIDSAFYGFCYGSLLLDPKAKYAYCSPILSRLADGTLTNAVGSLPPDYYSLDLIRFVQRYELGTFNHLSGWYIHPHGGVTARKPLYDLMQSLFKQRSFSEDASYFVKRVMTGIIGKMLESRVRNGSVVYGDRYNPIYHALILSQTEFKVGEFIIENDISQSELVHVGVDGVKATKGIPLPAKVGMGKWRDSGEQPTLITSPAGIWTNDRSPQNVPLPILLSLLEAHPNSVRYEFGKWDLSLPTLGLRQNRSYSRLPRTGRQLLNEKFQSSPVVL